MDIITIGIIVADFITAPVKKVPARSELRKIERLMMLNIDGIAAVFCTFATLLCL